MDFSPNTESLSVRAKTAGIFVLVLVALVFVPSRWFGLGKASYQKEDQITDPATLLVQQLHSDANEDPDGDGIPNWQETLLGTDKNSPTTNGVQDVIKLAASEKSGTTSPVATVRANPTILAELNNPNNISSQIAKNNAGLTVYLGQQENVDQTTAEKVGENVMTQAMQLAQAKQYTLRDITVTDKESFTDIKDYGNTIGLLFIDVLKKITKTDDLAPVSAFMLHNDKKALGSYAKNIAVLAAARDTLLAMQVPSSAAEAHVAAINAIEQYRNVLYNFSQADTDATRALVALNSYKDTLIALVEVQKTYATYFDGKGVVFSPKDGGYLFMQNLGQ